MARWVPASERVGPDEHVGRRLFDEPMLAGGQGQPRFAGLDLRNFEEKRDREFSLDRLGRQSIDKSAVGYLLPRATAAGARFMSPKTFSGWAVLRARQLENPPVGLGRYGKFPVIASPERGDGLLENIYHAHIVTPDVDNYSKALHLRQLYAHYGSVHPALVKGRGSFGRFVAKWLPEWLSNLVRRISSPGTRERSPEKPGDG